MYQLRMIPKKSSNLTATIMTDTISTMFQSCRSMLVMAYPVGHELHSLVCMMPARLEWRSAGQAAV